MAACDNAAILSAKGHTLPVWLGRHANNTQLVDLLPNIGSSANERVRVTSVDGLGLEALHLLKVNQPGTIEGVLSGADETVHALLRAWLHATSEAGMTAYAGRPAHGADT